MDLGSLVPLLMNPLQKRRNIGIFLDYDGTLRDFVDEPEHATPDEALITLLKDLASHTQISLALVSGRSSSFLEKHWGGVGITLVAEHGYRWLEHGKGAWKPLNPDVSTDWKDAIRAALEQAALLSPGTQVEEKQSALVWHYRKAHPQLGEWRAKDLWAALTSMAANLPVTVHHGKKIIEVASVQVNKGLAVDFLLRRWKCDVALVAGDDQTDETMLSLRPQQVEYFAVKVGEGTTRAAYRTDISGLRGFLEQIRASLPN